MCILSYCIFSINTYMRLTYALEASSHTIPNQNFSLNVNAKLKVKGNLFHTENVINSFRKRNVSLESNFCETLFSLLRTSLEHRSNSAQLDYINQPIILFIARCEILVAFLALKYPNNIFIFLFWITHNKTLFCAMPLKRFV